MNYDQYIYLKECAANRDYESWNKFRKTEKGHNIDLKFASFSRLNLSNFDLSFSNLLFTKFDSTNLEGASIKGAKIGFKNKIIEIFYSIFYIIITLLPISIFYLYWEEIKGSFSHVLHVDFKLGVYFLSLLTSFSFLRFCGLPIKQVVIVSFSLLISLLAINFFQIETYSIFGKIGMYIIIFILFALPLGILRLSEYSLIQIVIYFHIGNTFYVTGHLYFASVIFIFGVLGLFIDFNDRLDNLKAFKKAIDTNLAKGPNIPYKTEDLSKQQLLKLEENLKKINNVESPEKNLLTEQIENLKLQITKQETFKNRIEQSFKDLQKPNSNINRILYINWGLIIFFLILSLSVLCAIIYIEYQVFEKFWFNDKKNYSEIPYLAYSPIIIGIIIFSFSISQFNKRLKELNNIYDRTRFISEVESTLRAFGNFYVNDDNKVENYFTQTIDKLQDYYFKTLSKDPKIEEKEESSESKLIEILTKLIDNK